MHCEKFLVTKWISNNTYSAGCNCAGGERVVGSFSVFLKNRKKKKELILHSVLVKQKEILTACWLLVRKMAQIWSYCCKILNVEIVARRPKRINFFFSALQALFRIVRWPSELLFCLLEFPYIKRALATTKAPKQKRHYRKTSLYFKLCREYSASP